MVLQNSDDDTCDKFELPRDHEKMRKILQEYEELLTACLAEIERFGEEFFFSNVLVNGKSIEPSMCIKLANEARHIMAFIKKETEGKARHELCSITSQINNTMMFEEFQRLEIIRNQHMVFSNFFE